MECCEMEETTGSVIVPSSAVMQNAELPASPTEESNDSIVKTENIQPEGEDEQNAAPSLFSQVLLIFDDVVKKIEHTETPDLKKEVLTQVLTKVEMLILKLEDFKIHLNALKSAIDSRENSRLELMKTIESLSQQLHESQELLASRKKRKKNIQNGVDSDSEELTETELNPDDVSDWTSKRSRKTVKRFEEADNIIHNNGDDASDTEINSKSFENIHLLKSDDSAQNLASSSNKSKKRRGKLPENSTSKLKKWIFDHWFHPYPSEEEKVVLCNETGLSLSQLNNWFTNARRRVLPKSKAAGLLPNTPSALNPDGTPMIPPTSWSPQIKRVQQHTYLPPPQGLVGVTQAVAELIAGVTKGPGIPTPEALVQPSDNNSMNPSPEMEHPKSLLT